MTEWIELSPALGHRPNRGEFVSVAWRTSEGKSRTRRAAVSIGKHVTQALGWAPNIRLVGAFAPDEGLLRLSPAREAGWKLTGKGTVRTIAIALPLKHEATEPATTCEYMIDGNALVITLPPWATAAKRAEADAKDVSAAMQRAAKAAAEARRRAAA